MNIRQGLPAVIGAAWLAADRPKGVQVFANISKRVEPPTFSELTGGQSYSANDEQRANTLEVGMRWKP